MFKIQI
jgi:translation initiation factor 3 subunit D